MNSRRLMVGVLATLLVFGLALSTIEAWRTGDWLGTALNLGPELVGAVVTYVLFDQFVERREQAEAEKERLIADLGSSVNDVAKAAADKLRQHGWHKDGSLSRAYLTEANLSGANLREANLREAKLFKADLSVADLRWADLRWASLWRANLSGANLRNAKLCEAKLNEADLSEADLRRSNLNGAGLMRVNLDGAKLDAAILPDGTKWTPDSNLARFTDPDQPELWRSDDRLSPAYRGKDDE